MDEFCVLSKAVVSEGFCAFTLPLDSIGEPRSILSVGISDFLFLDRSKGVVAYAYDSDNDGITDKVVEIASASNLNHGLDIHEGYIYASSDTTVYRWSYQENDFLSPVGERQTVVYNINENGRGGAPRGHTTRTLIFDNVGRLYISVGSAGNVDVDSYRSRIRRFPIADFNGDNPFDFQNGEVFADGLRNEVGLAFDRHEVLWGVENGADRLERDDLGGDIHNDNPAEELNRFKEEDAGKHWGYPYCWTEYFIPQGVGLGRGTVWTWPTFMYDYTDEMCRNDFLPPAISMQAHSAPLGITFYEWKPYDELPMNCPNTSFPIEMDGYAFIAFHGSWNRDIPTGYKVVYVPMDENGDATNQPIDLLAHEPPNAKWEDGFRPVDVDFDDCGRLLITSDGTGGRGTKIVRMDYIHNDFVQNENDNITQESNTRMTGCNETFTSCACITQNNCPPSNAEISATNTLFATLIIMTFGWIANKIY